MMKKESDNNGKNKKRESLSNRAYRELKNLILDNRLTLGYQYMENELAELLQMSRTPMREALLRLANEGLVEIRPRHGMRVKPISVDDMREIYQILTSLESCAAELAARRGLEDQEIAALTRAVDEMEAALEADELETWAAADSEFHRLLVQYSNNQRLISLVDTFIVQSHRVRMLTLRMRPKPQSSNNDHRNLVEAIKRRDADSARQIHRTHREESGRMLVELLDSYGMNNI